MRPWSVLFLAWMVSADVASAEPAAILTRGDIVASYTRFERVYRDHPPGPERLAEVNRAFGSTTRAFFRGGFRDVIKGFDSIAASLRPAGMNSAARIFAESLRVEVEPPVVVAGADPGPTLRIYSVYDADLPGDAKIDLALRVRIGERSSPLTRISAGSIGASVAIPSSVRSLDPGRRIVEIALPDGSAVVAGRWFVTVRPLDELRAANEKRLAALRPESPALEDAIRIVRDRNGLLNDRPDRSRTIDLLTDFVALSGEVEREIAQIERGLDPYARRPGHLWRTITIGRLRVPVRIYVPQAVSTGKPLPLVVALHGAGADENVFPEAYGAGRIVDLAEERGFLMASPLTTGFLGNARCLPALLAALEPHVRVDPERIYLLGHSLGGMAATLFAQSEAGRLAGVVALAGGGRMRADRPTAPTLFIAGEIDPIVPASRVRGAYEHARAAGLPVEYREMKGYGHTLLVGDHLPAVMDWLLERRRTREEAR